MKLQNKRVVQAFSLYTLYLIASFVFATLGEWAKSWICLAVSVLCAILGCFILLDPLKWYSNTKPTASEDSKKE